MTHFVTMMSFLNVHKINPVKEYLHFIDVITLERRSVVGLLMTEGETDRSNMQYAIMQITVCDRASIYTYISRDLMQVH